MTKLDTLICLFRDSRRGDSVITRCLPLNLFNIFPPFMCCVKRRFPTGNWSKSNYFY